MTPIGKQPARGSASKLAQKRVMYADDAEMDMVEEMHERLSSSVQQNSVVSTGI